MNTQTVLFCFLFFLLVSMQCEASTRTLKFE
ncbi:dienelactone hydrolase, partial [Pseudomonas sp. HMWF031]